MASKKTVPLSIGSSAASGYGHCGAAVKSHFLPVEAEFWSIRLRSWFAKGGILDTTVSKSKSKPSTAAPPNGRGALEPAALGPKLAQTLLAAVTAASAEENPPSV